MTGFDTDASDTAYSPMGHLIGLRHDDGVWRLTGYGEAYYEHLIPQWQARLAEHDARQEGALIYEGDILPESTEVIADWDYFLSLSYTDPNEREAPNMFTHVETSICSNTVTVTLAGHGTEDDALEAVLDHLGHLYGGYREVQWNAAYGHAYVILDRH